MQFSKLNIRPIFFLLLLQFLMLNTACKKFVTIDLPPDRVPTASLFTSDSTANTAIAGLYSQMMQVQLSISNGGLSVYTSLSADEITTTTSHINYDPFRDNSLNDRTSVISANFWVPAFTSLYQINAMLEGLDMPTGVSPGLRQQLQGELKFGRAFLYFTLVNLFGDVPLVLTTDYSANAVLPRTSELKIYEQVIKDLKEAKDLLSVNFPTPGKVRPTTWAASALLAKVYLYKKDYIQSDAEATRVINSGLFHLVTNLNQVFIGNSPETIWSLLPNNRNTAEGATFIPNAPTSVPTLILHPSLINSFETGDQRKTNWLGENIVDNTSYYYPLKYKIRNDVTVTEHNILLRFAEMLLIRAEARAKQDKLPEALDDLNRIRLRAGIPGLSILDKSLILSSIEQENRTEFFAENGHRWFDLKRLDKADEILQPLKVPNWQSTDALYPLPFTQLTLNPALVQNPGY